VRKAATENEAALSRPETEVPSCVKNTESPIQLLIITGKGSVKWG